MLKGHSNHYSSIDATITISKHNPIIHEFRLHSKAVCVNNFAFRLYSHQVPEQGELVQFLLGSNVNKLF